MPFTKATMSQRLVWLDAVRSTENSAVTWKTLFSGRLPIDVAERVALRVAVDRLRDRRAEDERVVDVLVGAPQPLQAVGRGLEPPHRLVRILEVEGILAAAMGEAVDAHELVGKHVVQHHVPQAAAAQAQRLLLRERREPERHQQLQRRNLGLMFLGGVEGHRACSRA
jgi:hypothetical protein